MIVNEPKTFKLPNLASGDSGDIIIQTTDDANIPIVEISPQSTAQNQFKAPSHFSLRSQLRQKKLLIINPKRKNGLIIYKTYHAEFAGPGAIIGGNFDLDTQRLLAVGNLSLIVPQDSRARKQAYKMRRQWVRLTKQIIDNPQPTERAQVILNQFEHWFDASTVADLPDEAFALLVGVLPQTIRKVRNIELL